MTSVCVRASVHQCVCVLVLTSVHASDNQRVCVSQLQQLGATDSHPLHVYDSFKGLVNCDREKDIGMCAHGAMSQPRAMVEGPLSLQCVLISVPCIQGNRYTHE